MNNNNVTQTYASFNYYPSVYKMTCSSCQETSDHTFLRYRTFLSKKLPIFPTRNTYFFICIKCGHVDGNEDELNLMKVLQQIRGKRPVKFNEDLILKGNNDDNLYESISHHQTKLSG